MKKREFRLNSIRIKLIAGMVAICLIPLLVLGIGTYIQSKAKLNEKLTLTSTQTLSEINDGLQEYFTGITQLVSITSSNYHFVNVDEGDNSSYIQDLLNNIQANNSDLVSVYYGTASKKMMISPLTQLPDGYDPTSRPWYQKAVEAKGQVVLTPPYEDAASGNNVITIAKTVEKDGQVVGVMAVDCTLGGLTEKIAKKEVGNTGYVFLAETDGTILAHPQADLINTDTASKLSFWESAKAQESGFVRYEYNGQKKFGAFQTNAITGWKIVATLDEAELSFDTKSIIQTTVIIIIIMGLIAISFSVFFGGSVAKNILKLKEVFAKASNGDLTVSVTASTKDEFSDLANSFNLMMNNISTLMGSVTASSETVLETSATLANMSSEVTLSIGEVARAIEEVSRGAINQAQDAQDGATEMESLSDKLDAISTNSHEMDEISSNTKQLSSKGLSVVDTLIEKSSKTKSSTDEVDHIVEDMYESTKQISAISDTLASITSQTNLLSLNASIESARAGEAGRGFAVVAGEIRALAEQSKDSTEEIKVIIENIQKKSEVAAEAIKSTKAIVDEQDVAVGQTKDIFSEILGAIEKMIVKVDEIRGSINVTNQNKTTLVSAMDNISAISQETASASEEVTASTEEITATMEEFTRYSNELKDLANQLGNEINKFKIK